MIVSFLSSQIKKYDRNLLFVILFLFLSSQLIMGGLDSLESRSNHAEDLAHMSHSGENIAIDSQCEDGSAFEIGQNSCWHYPSRYALSSGLFFIILYFIDGFVILKITAIILTIIEGLLIHRIALRHINYKSANISILVYFSIPSVFYYAQMPSVHIPLISILIAANWAIPNILDVDKGPKSKIIPWAYLSLAPLLSPLSSFAWAGLAVFIVYYNFDKTKNNYKSQKNNILSFILLIIFPVFAYFMHLNFNTYIGIDDSYMSGRLTARTGFSHLLELESWLSFADRITILFGPLPFLLFFSIIRKKTYLNEINKLYFAPILATIFIGFFSIVIFNLTFLTCCRYFAYPLSASIALLFPLFCNEVNISNQYIAIFMISLLLGVSLHSSPTNYSDRSVQEYISENGMSDDQLVIIIDTNFDNYNAIKWQLSSQRIDISPNISENNFNKTLELHNPDYLILSNQTNSLGHILDILSQNDYCGEFIKTNDNVPENFVNGYLSFLLPVKIWSRC